MFWVRLVGVFALLDRLDNPRRVPFCVLDFLLCFLIHRAPDIRDVEEGCGCVECCRCLPGALSARASIQESPGILCHTVCLHYPFRSVECLLRELFNVCLPSHIICDGIFARVLCLGLRIAWLASRHETMLPGHSNPFHLVHQVGRVVQNALVGRVQLLRQDLVYSPVFACGQLGVKTWQDIGALHLRITYTNTP